MDLVKQEANSKWCITILGIPSPKTVRGRSCLGQQGGKGAVCYKSFAMNNLKLVSSLTKSTASKDQTLPCAFLRNLHTMTMHFSNSAAFPINVFLSTDGWILEASFLQLQTWQRKIGSVHLEKLSGRGGKLKLKGMQSVILQKLEQ